MTRDVIGMIISLGLSSPFLWALMAKRPNNLAYRELWLDKRYNRGPLFLLEFSRVIIGLSLITFWVFRIFDTTIAAMIAVPSIIIILMIFGSRIRVFYQHIERNFLRNLNARESQEFNSLSANVSRKKAYIESELLPWDAHIVQLTVSPQAEFIGRTLSELQWREKFGINVVYIKRGESLMSVPDRNSILLPFDEVGVLATDHQIQIFKPVFDSVTTPVSSPSMIDDIVLRKFLVDEHTRLQGLTIRESGLREQTNGLIIGIERNNERILNPESTTTFQWHDIIWVVGEKKKIDGFIARF